MVNDTKAPGGKRQCSRGAVKEGMCTQHWNKVNGAKKPAATSAATSTPPVNNTPPPANNNNAPAAVPAAGTCPVLLKSGKRKGEACGAKITKAGKCGKHAPKDKKALETEPGKFPRACEVLTKDGGNCPNVAYGMNDEKGVPACALIHGGPKKPATAGSTTSSRKKKAVPDTGNMPLALIASSVSGYLLEKLNSEAVAVIENEGFSCNGEAMLWLKECIDLYAKGSTPGNTDMVDLLDKLHETSNGEDFQEAFEEDGEPGPLMVRVIYEILGEDMKNIQWLFDLLQKYSEMSIEKADQVKNMWNSVKDDFKIQAAPPAEPEYNTKSAPDAEGPATDNSMFSQAYMKAQAMGAANVQKQKEEMSAEKDATQPAQEEKEGDDDLLAAAAGGF